MQHIETYDKQLEFKDYLDHSPRIIFSAKYGEGKTQFLKEITVNNEFENYKFFTIYPVNYVVAENADIFEYVKRDILLQLGEAKLLNDIDIDSLISSFASFETFREVLAFLVSCLPHGEFINKIIDKGLEIKERYNERKETLKKLDASFKVMKGGLYEEDGYTQMIRESLRLLREGINVEGGNKKSVLVIEDFDRLDPGHLFRILNVLSAHIDSNAYHNSELKNKFGFDNIVIVMDYETTKKLFHHIYGGDVSYEGYISKFMSCQPFYYSISTLAHQALYSHINEVIGLDKLVEYMPNIKKYIKKMSVRDVERILTFDYNIRKKKDSVEIMSYKFSCDLPIFKLFCIMVECGLSKVEIREDLGFQNDQSEAAYLELIYPLHLLSSEMYFSSYKSFTAFFDVRYDSDFVNKIDIIKTGQRRSNTKEIRTMVIKFRQVFRMMEECYNLSSLVENNNILT
jgi:hypothetical protein